MSEPQKQEVALKDALEDADIKKSTLLTNEEFAGRNLPALADIEGSKSVARLMSKAKAMLPAYLHGNPGECLAIVLLARDWGMNPYTVGQHSYIPTGSNRVGFDGQLVNAAINNSRRLVMPLRYEYEGKDKDLTCTAYGLLYYYDFEDHQLKKEPAERSVKVAMPKNITKPKKGGGTYQIDKGNSTLWDSDPEQQLAYKAARWWCRKFVPEILMGVYTTQEITEMGQQHRPGRDATATPASNVDSIIKQHQEEKENDPKIVNAEIVEEESTNEQSDQRQTPETTTTSEPEPEPVQTDAFPGCEICEGRGVVEETDPETGELTKGPCPECSKTG